MTGTETETVATKEIERGIVHSSLTHSLLPSDNSDQATPSALSYLTHYHYHAHTLTYREWGDRDRGGYSRNNNSNNNSSAGVNPVRDALVVSAPSSHPTRHLSSSSNRPILPSSLSAHPHTLLFTSSLLPLCLCPSSLPDGATVI